MTRTEERPGTHHRPQLFSIWLVCMAAALAIGITVFTFLGGNASAFAPEAHVDLQHYDTADVNGYLSAKESSSAFRVAIAPVISPEASVELYGDLIAYIARHVGGNPVLLRGENYSEVNDLLRMRQCEAAIVCTYSYVLAEAELGVKLLVAPEIAGSRVYHSIIIVPATSDASTLTDLRGKRFASCDVLSTSGWLYPMTQLKTAGYDADRFFSEHIISGSHDRSVFAVTSGLVDGAAVDSLVYDQMVSADGSLASRVKVIHRSPPFGMPPFVVPKSLPDEAVADLRRLLQDMHADTEGARILAGLAFDRFFVPHDGDYDSVRNLGRLWNGTQ